MTSLPSLSEIAVKAAGEPLTPDEIDEQVALTLDQRPPGGGPDRTFVHWVPTDEGAAAWAMDKLRILNEELADVAAHRAMLLQQIEAWYEDRIRNPRGRAQFFAAALEEYGLRWQAEDEKRRTLHLAGGGAVAVTVPKSPTVVVTDEAAVLRWAQENATDDPRRPGPQDCINTKPPTLYVNEVRKWIKPAEIEQDDTTVLVGVSVLTGEVVPGVVVEPPGPPRARVVL